MRLWILGAEKMKILVTSYNKTYSVESDEDVDAEALADMFKGLMVSMGFHPKNVDKLFNTEYEWFPEGELETTLEEKLEDLYKVPHSNSIVTKWHKECQEGK